jgi:hypothetical protein
MKHDWSMDCFWSTWLRFCFVYLENGLCLLAVLSKQLCECDVFLDCSGTKDLKSLTLMEARKMPKKRLCGGDGSRR